MAKIKEGFVLRNVAGSYYVVAVGNRSKTFKAIITINEVGAFIFNKLKDGLSVIDIAKAINNEFALPGKTEEDKINHAKNDINKFIKTMADAGIIEDE